MIGTAEACMIARYAQVKRRLYGQTERRKLWPRMEEPMPERKPLPSIPPSVRAIIDQIEVKYGTTFEDLCSSNWNGWLNETRAELWWRIKHEVLVAGAQPSNSLIGKWFGGKDHSTVSLALKRYRETMG